MNTSATVKPQIGAHHPIHELELTVRAHNALIRHGITTVGQLTACTEADVAAMWAIGGGTLDHIVAALAEHGLTLAGGTA